MMNLFYDEPDPDRFVRFDRYPRRLIRRLLRGKPPVRGHRRVFLNLLKGLDRLGLCYRVNDFRRAKAHPEETAGIVGKSFLLARIPWRNRILFGAAGFSHPSEDPRLLERLPVRRVLVPGEWMRKMFEPYYGARVAAWPVGIDTEEWAPSSAPKRIDVLVYDKVLWEHDRLEKELVRPVCDALAARGLRLRRIRYGFYREEEFRSLLAETRSMVFLCEHETQGIAYQQALSCGVPLFAWDRQGEWLDPAFYPRIRFGPVTGVPYWDARCGDTFRDFAGFRDGWKSFEQKAFAGAFRPRDYVEENLTLERCAREYARHYDEVSSEP